MNKDSILKKLRDLEVVNKIANLRVKETGLLNPDFAFYCVMAFIIFSGVIGSITIALEYFGLQENDIIISVVSLYISFFIAIGIISRIATSKKKKKNKRCFKAKINQHKYMLVNYMGFDNFEKISKKGKLSCLVLQAKEIKRKLFNELLEDENALLLALFELEKGNSDFRKYQEMILDLSEIATDFKNEKEKETQRIKEQLTLLSEPHKNATDKFKIKYKET